MPNFCYNTLKIKGTKEEIDSFVNKYQDVGIIDGRELKYISFEKILPTPLKNETDIIDNWYGWRIANWGTKWDVCMVYEFEISEDNGRCILNTSFDTAWDCPYRIYDLLMERYEDTSMEFETTYSQEGISGYGNIDFSKGKVTREEHRVYDV